MKILLCITEINYILKHSNRKVKLQYNFRTLMFLLYFMYQIIVALVRIRDLKKKKFTKI